MKASILALIARPDRENGQTLVEYGLLVTLLAMAVFAAVGLVGDEMVRLFTRVSSEFADAATTP